MKKILTILLLHLLSIPVWGQNLKEETHLKIRDEVRIVLEGYKSTLALLGDASTPSDERGEYINALLEQYFVNDKVFMFNDLDPTKSTGKSFTARIYLDNLILWYKDGFTATVEMDNLQISQVLREGDLNYVKVNATQRLRGAYSVRSSYTNSEIRLTFYISFKLEERQSSSGLINLISNAKISKVEEVSFVPTITLKTPDAATTSLGKQILFPITWESNTISPLSVDLLRKGEVVANLTKEAVDGTFGWIPTNDLKSGGDYKLRVRTADGYFYDETPGTFSIEEKAFIRVLYPTAQDSLVKGDTYNLIWETNVKEAVNVELLREGKVVETIGQNVKQNTTTWTVPTKEALESGKGYQIRISDVRGSVVGISEGDLVVTNERVEDFIRIVQPVAGSVLKRNGKYSVEWRHNLNGNFRVELIQGASNRYPISTQATPQGNLAWKVEGKYGTGQDYRVEITSLTNPNVKARSNVFTIKKRSPLKWFATAALLGGGYLAYTFLQNATVDNSLPLPPLPSNDR